MAGLETALNLCFQTPQNSLWAICSFKSRILPIVHKDIIDNCDDLEICENCKLYPKYQQTLSGFSWKSWVLLVFCGEKKVLKREVGMSRNAGQDGLWKEIIPI